MGRFCIAMLERLHNISSSVHNEFTDRHKITDVVEVVFPAMPGEEWPVRLPVNKHDLMGTNARTSVIPRFTMYHLSASGPTTIFDTGEK